MVSPVSTFCNENEALSAVSSKSESFHVAIVEVSSSDSNGCFKFLETAKDFPTIMTSNIQCLSTMMKCIALGAVEFLRKPISEDKLRNIWQHVVHKAFNAGGSVLCKSLRPLKESVASMLERKVENLENQGLSNENSEETESNVSLATENGHETSPGSDRYPALATPQLNQGSRLVLVTIGRVRMGASSSSEQKPTSEVNEVESEAAYTGALPMLQSCFAKLADPQSHAIPLESLQQCFLLSHEDPVCESPSMPAYFPALLNHVGQFLVDENFVIEKGGVNWVEFLKWYVKFCGKMPASVSLHTLLKIVAAVTSKSGLPMRLEFESSYGDDDGKISGYLLPSNVLMLLWMCWTMLWNSKTPKISKGQQILCRPDVTHLVLSAVVSCAEVGSDLNLWDCDISSLEVQLPVGIFLTWPLTALGMAPLQLRRFFSRIS